MSAAFRVAFNDTLGTRKKVETITSNKGESEPDFLKRVGKRTFSLSKKNSVEHCGNICSMTDANGNVSFSVEIMTDNNPIACGINTNSCSAGFSPSNISIHSHVRKFLLTDELRKFDSKFNRMPSRMTQARGEIDRFSKPDLSFVQKTGFDLYLSDSKGLLRLPANAKSRDDTVRIK